MLTTIDFPQFYSRLSREKRKIGNVFANFHRRHSLHDFIAIQLTFDIYFILDAFFNELLTIFDWFQLLLSRLKCENEEK